MRHDMDLVSEIYSKVVIGNAEEVRILISQALRLGLTPKELLDHALIAAMAEVGDRFEHGEFFVPEMMIAARAVKTGMEILKPLLSQHGIQAVGRVVIGTVKGDLHDIGKNLVIIMLEGAGFDVVDLGVDVYPESFIQAIQEYSPDFVGISALLTTTSVHMKSTVEAIKKAGLRGDVKIMVGGAPITQQFADQIGADIYGQDANIAVRKAKEAILET